MQPAWNTMIDSTLAGIPHARSRVGGHELPARGDPHRHVELKTFFGSRYAHVYFIHQMYLLPGSAKPLKVKTPSFHPPYQVFCASSFPGHRKSHLAFYQCQRQPSSSFCSLKGLAASPETRAARTHTTKCSGSLQKQKETIITLNTKHKRHCHGISIRMVHSHTVVRVFRFLLQI